MIIFNKSEVQKSSDFILSSSTEYKTKNSSHYQSQSEEEAEENKRKIKGIESKLSNILTEANKKFLQNLGFILKK